MCICINTRMPMSPVLYNNVYNIYTRALYTPIGKIFLHCYTLFLYLSLTFFLFFVDPSSLAGGCFISRLVGPDVKRAHGNDIIKKKKKIHYYICRMSLLQRYNSENHYVIISHIHIIIHNTIHSHRRPTPRHD